MYCLNGKCYLPQPPRAWSRVQNSCTFENENINGNEIVRVPYTNKEVPLSRLATELAMLNKGNVLQYKKNSSNLTKNQRYSQIAKGQWTNRHKTWATQSANGYTNPNIQSLARVGGVNVTLNGVPSNLPVTCPLYNNNNLVIQDFGTLICGSKENVCTGETIIPVKIDNCHLTSDSNVPGPIETLCWNDGTPTWYPRQRYFMTNSTDKWPVNAPLVSAVKPTSPLLSVSVVFSTANLSWTIENMCLPISSYNVFKNNVLIINTTKTSYSDVFDNTNDTITSYYVVAISGTILSNPSNIVYVSNKYSYTTNGSITNYNPLTLSTEATGFTYILFNNISNLYFFNLIDGFIPNLYYVIIGTGSQGQHGYSDNYYSQGGVGSGAGGCYNGVISNFPKNNYSITIPDINLSSDTIFKNATDDSVFNITATSGEFITRGAVNMTLNSVTTVLSPSSSVSGEFGVGGGAYGINDPVVITVGSNGGDVFKGSNGSVGEYINFLGDGLLSNVYLGGGGGGGGAGNGGITNSGYNGGGGGGGSGTSSTGGGTGINGLNGLSNGNGGSALNISQGYGAGGGGGGSPSFSSIMTIRGIGGNGGRAMLLIYFK